MENIRLLEEYTDIEGLKHHTLFEFKISKFIVCIKIIQLINKYYHGKSRLKFYNIDEFKNNKMHLFSELNQYDKLVDLVNKQL